MSVPRVGVLVMAHGTPATPEEIEPFYTRIRRGRPPSAAQLEELTGRYAAIGGTSPLARLTRHQVDGVADLLHHDAPGHYLVRYGAKHTDPTIEAAAGELVAAGVARVIGLVLTPHQSAVGSRQYFDRAAAACADVPFVAIERWYGVPAFVDLVADRVAASVHDLGCGTLERAVAVFTAHSVPRRSVTGGDRYPDEVAESAALVAEAAEVDDYLVAWQSGGRTDDEWVGPDLLDVLRSLAGDGVHGVAVCPIGFVSDHLEVLYDLDVEARGVAEAAGLAFTRTPSLNADRRFLRLLADEVHAAEGRAGGGQAFGGAGSPGGAP